MVTKESIVQLLKTNDKAVARALVALAARQTADERASEHTKHLNGRGFRPQHARMGTSMASFYSRNGYLTPKQLAYWRVKDITGKTRIEIYARQLLEVAQEKASATPVQAPVALAVEPALFVAPDGEAERYMQQMDLIADREGTERDELAKFMSRCRLERP